MFLALNNKNHMLICVYLSIQILFIYFIMEKTSKVFFQRFFGICLLFVFFSQNSVTAIEYNIIPYPKQLIPESGSFIIKNMTTVKCSVKQPEIYKLAVQFTDQFKVVSGLKLDILDISSTDTVNSIVFELTSEIADPEGYQLIVSPNTIRIKANAANGFFYGLQTLYQLLPAEIYGKKVIKGKNWFVPSVRIIDSPRFLYRGLHLDVCRHFFPLEFIKKYIDAMAIHKFNSFHWHLTDDQGWRIEIKKYPLLTSIGSNRDETLVGQYYSHFPKLYDGKPYGGFYTQAEAREIVKYAKDRFITVIPEIEMPGHAQAAVASYPWLSCTPDSTIKVATKWGIFADVYCPTDTTFHFLEDVLTEIMDIFPSNYIHIGGDECLKDRWKESAECQKLIKSLNLKDENGLQSYFVERIEKFVNSKGRQIIGWDEILDGGLAPNATVMSWRGNAGGIAAAKSGHNVIMTPNAYCYFDHYQADPESEPVTIGGFLPLRMVYQFEPVPPELTSKEAGYILGAQANLWSEYLPSTESVEYMAFPRVSAMAEVVWGAKENRNWESFRQRMPADFERYQQLDIQPSNAFYEVQFQSELNSENKIQISLVSDDPHIRIFYTTNGKVPTEHNELYSLPFTLNNSSVITAASFLKGKMVGKATSKSYIVSKLTGLQYTININSTGISATNSNALTDGIPGNTISNSQWVAVGKGSDVEILVDLQRVQKIERFTVGLLNSPAICALYPTGIILYGSTDDINYKLIYLDVIKATDSSAWEMFRPEFTFPATDARYLKIRLKSAGLCPVNNPDCKNGSLIMMDEIGAW